MLETHRWARVISALAVMGVLAVAVAPASAGPPSGPGPGNSPNAQACQEGWQALIRADGTSFANPGECTSHAAKGGTLFYANEAPCLNGGYTNLVTSTGQSFSDQAACVTYVRAGGTLQPKPTGPTLTVTLGPPFQSGSAFFCGLYIEGSGLLPASPITVHVSDATIAVPGPYSSFVAGHAAGDSGTFVSSRFVITQGHTSFATGTTDAGERITSNSVTCLAPAP